MPRRARSLNELTSCGNVMAGSADSNGRVESQGRNHCGERSRIFGLS